MATTNMITLRHFVSTRGKRIRPRDAGVTAFSTCTEEQLLQLQCYDPERSVTQWVDIAKWVGDTCFVVVDPEYGRLRVYNDRMRSALQVCHSIAGYLVKLTPKAGRIYVKPGGMEGTEITDQCRVEALLLAAIKPEGGL